MEGHVFVTISEDISVTSYSEANTSWSDKFSCEWIADSEASEHMTYHREWFTNFTPIPSGQRGVRVANGNLIWAEGIGDISIESQINGQWITGTLRRVLYVPELRRNLVSICQITEKNMACIYKKDRCEIHTDGGQGVLVMTGHKEGQLWRINIRVKMTKANIVATEIGGTGQSEDSLTNWHHRLGHVNVDTITTMEKRATVTGLKITGNSSIPFCEGCAHGKNKRQPFPTHEVRDRASLSGTFYHADVCGPMHQPSLGGARYFINFKDDHSGYRVLFCIQQKSEVFDCYQRLWRISKEAMGNLIQKLRTDRGTEFVNKQFNDFNKHHDIRHELSVAYTPE
jgi:hypothetical protein